MLYQSLIGFDKIIDHLDGSKIYIKNKEVIKEGDIKIIKGLGMKDLTSNINGDLHIIFSVKYPNLKLLKENESQLLKALLAKMEPEELDREDNIIKNKNKLKKYKLEKDKINIHNEAFENNHREHREEHNPGQQCVHQ